MGLGILALALLLPAIVVAVILAISFAIGAARTGRTLTAIAGVASLLMILNPLFFVSFATRPQSNDENPIFLIEYGMFPSALLAVAALTAGLMLRRRYIQLTGPAMLGAALVFLGLAHTREPAAGAGSLDGVLQWLRMIGLVSLAAYPLIWVLAFRELSEFAAPRLARLKQG